MSDLEINEKKKKKVSEDQESEYNDDISLGEKEVFVDSDVGAWGEEVDFRKNQEEKEQEKKRLQQLKEQNQTELKESQSQNQKPILIIDANAFIKCLDITSLSAKYEIVSSFNVIREIRDKRAKDKFTTLPFDIIDGECSPESVKFVHQFAEKTGDFASLHLNDMEIIAIAYEYCKSQNKMDLLRKEPPAPINLDTLKAQREARKLENKQNNKEDDSEEEYSSEEEEEDNEEEKKKDEENTNNNENNEDEDDGGWITVPKRETKVIEKKEDIEDNGHGWINPQNLEKFLKRTQQNEKDQKIGIFVMTADYAMQNVLLQIGIPILSIDNMVIRKAKRFVLECFMCEKLCLDNREKWCPTCKNHTLLKVSCSINADGSFILYRKKNFSINTRGFIYSIPKAKGGRNSKDLVLREDELLSGEKFYRLKRQQKNEEKQYKQAMMDLNSGYEFSDKMHKQNQKKIEVGYGHKNPNDQYHIKNKRKKRK